MPENPFYYAKDEPYSQDSPDNSSLLPNKTAEEAAAFKFYWGTVEFH